jgi:hypothetical protein
MAAVNGGGRQGDDAGSAPPAAQEGFTVDLDGSVGVKPAVSHHHDAGPVGEGLRTSMSVALDAMGGYGETETTLPCAPTVESCLPCIVLFVGPCCCCVRSHPDKVCVPFDLFTERVYYRPLAVVTFASFTWQAFVAYFVTLTGTDATEFSLCGRNFTDFSQDASDNQPLRDTALSTIGVLQTGWFGLVFAVLIGAGNSRYEKRCWVRYRKRILCHAFLYSKRSFYQDRLGTNIGKALKIRCVFLQGWVSPVIAAFSLSANGPALRWCAQEISEQGDDGEKTVFWGAVLFKCDLFTKTGSGHTQGKLKNRCVFSGSFTLYAGATSNYISTGFYVVQLFLSVLLLLRRRRNCAGSGDGKWCGPMEFTEPLPIKPLATRAPGSPLTAAASGGLSAGLLAGASEVEPTAVSTGDAESLIVAAVATGSSAEPARARIPLRFWIALTLSATVVGFLAAMGALYGTKNALFWSHLYV